jgi:hypothetical protein
VKLWVLFATAVLVVGCSKKEDVIVETAADQAMTAEDIDRDALALLPGGAIGLVRVDTKALYASEFGQRMHLLTAARLPVPPSAGFEPTRDLTTVHLGIYSMQGADFAMVATGRFDPKSIESAADGTTQTPLGAPLVKASYGGRTLYVSRNVGFTVLTERTVLLGNETGIRRAIDRIAEGRAKRDLPKWAAQHFATPNAPIVAIIDLQSSPPVEAAAAGFSFVNGLKRARILGNFEPPGMNFVGTLTYADAESAQQASASILGLHQTLRSYSFFMSLAGIQNPIRELQAQPVGSDTQVAITLERQAIEWLINELANRLGVPPQTIQANVGPAVAPAGP